MSLTEASLTRYGARICMAAIRLLQRCREGDGVVPALACSEPDVAPVFGSRCTCTIEHTANPRALQAYNLRNVSVRCVLSTSHHRLKLVEFNRMVHAIHVAHFLCKGPSSKTIAFVQWQVIQKDVSS